MGVEANGYFICSNCVKTREPGKRFKVFATEHGKKVMRDHVEICKVKN